MSLAAPHKYVAINITHTLIEIMSSTLPNTSHMIPSCAMALLYILCIRVDSKYKKVIFKNDPAISVLEDAKFQKFKLNFYIK